MAKFILKFKHPEKHEELETIFYGLSPLFEDTVHNILTIDVIDNFHQVNFPNFKHIIREHQLYLGKDVTIKEDIL